MSNNSLSDSRLALPNCGGTACGPLQLGTQEPTLVDEEASKLCEKTLRTGQGREASDIFDEKDPADFAKFAESDFDPLQLLRNFTFETVPLTDQIFTDVVSYLNIVFCGAPQALTVQDLKAAKEYHPYINQSSTQWWDGYHFGRWQQTSSCYFKLLWDFIMSPSSNRTDFNALIQNLSRAKQRRTWFKRTERNRPDSESHYKENETSVSKNTSVIELQQLRSAIDDLSDHISLKEINFQLKRAYVFAMSDRALSAGLMNLPNPAAPSRAMERPSSFRFLDLPAEIREQVLDLLLITKLESNWQHEGYRHHLIVGFQWWDLDCRSSLSTIYPEVLRTCRQILQESLPILYRKNNFKFLNSRYLCWRGYEQFSEECLSTMGVENVAMIEKLWLPGDPQCYPKSGLEPRRTSHMSLKRLLEKHPQLCHLKVLAFEVPLFDHAQAESWTSMKAYDKLEPRIQEHLDILNLSSRWDHMLHEFDQEDRDSQKWQRLKAKLKSMLQKVNCSTYTATVLRAVTEFRAKCGDTVLLYETGYPARRQFILSRIILPTQYGQTPTHFDSPWTDDFAVDEVRMSAPPNEPLLTLLENWPAAPSC